MSRLNLEAFKAQADEHQTKELDELSGGILGACHCPYESPSWVMKLFGECW